jgi:hypothetical protein
MEETFGVWAEDDPMLTHQGPVMLREPGANDSLADLRHIAACRRTSQS